MLPIARPITLLALLCVSACGGYTIKDHAATPMLTETPRRVMLVSSLARNNGKPKLEQSLYRGVTTALAACGISVETYATNPMTLDDERKLLAARNSFKPDAVLMLRQTETGLDGDGSGSYVIALITDPGRRTIWTGKGRFGGVTERDPALEFGTALVRAMAADGALRNCPASSPTI